MSGLLGSLINQLQGIKPEVVAPTKKSGPSQAFLDTVAKMVAVIDKRQDLVLSSELKEMFELSDNMSVRVNNYIFRNKLAQSTTSGCKRYFLSNKCEMPVIGMDAQVLDYLSKHPVAFRTEILDALKVHRTTLWYSIKRLEERGCLKTRLVADPNYRKPLIQVELIEVKK